MNYKTRKAVPEDSEVLTHIAIRSKAYWGYSDDFMNNCKAELKIKADDIGSESFHYEVLESENQILGFYGIEKLQNNQAELDALFVIPEKIGKGIGKKLISIAKNYAKEQGFHSIKIQGDPHAKPFYLKSGAKLIGEKESDSIKGRFLPLFLIELNVN